MRIVDPTGVLRIKFQASYQMNQEQRETERILQSLITSNGNFGDQVLKTEESCCLDRNCYFD